jgi:hypothetical protein
MTKDLRNPLKQRPFPQRTKQSRGLINLSKCLARSDPPLDSDSVGLSGPKQIGLFLGLGLSGPKQIGLFLGLGLTGPKQIGLFLGLELSGPRPDRTRKSAPLKSDSGLDSDSVRFLGCGLSPRGRAQNLPSLCSSVRLLQQQSRKAVCSLALPFALLMQLPTKESPPPCTCVNLVIPPRARI